MTNSTATSSVPAKYRELERLPKDDRKHELETGPSVTPGMQASQGTAFTIVMTRLVETIIAKQVEGLEATGELVSIPDFDESFERAKAEALPGVSWRTNRGQ